MNKSELIENFWRNFCAINPNINPNESYQVWFFGDDSEMAKELVELVLQGKKTATASLTWEYENNPEDAPRVGNYSVVTDYEGIPQCVVKTTEVRVLPFNEVDAEFAFDEGEGDQSLDYWRGVHWDYFSRQCVENDREPDITMLINCERFQLL